MTLPCTVSILKSSLIPLAIEPSPESARSFAVCRSMYMMCLTSGCHLDHRSCNKAPRPGTRFKQRFKPHNEKKPDSFLRSKRCALVTVQAAHQASSFINIRYRDSVALQDGSALCLLLNQNEQYLAMERRGHRTQAADRSWQPEQCISKPVTPSLRSPHIMVVQGHVLAPRTPSTPKPHH